MGSNYEVMKRRMQGEFLNYDQSAMIARFGLDADESHLRFDFMGGACRIDRRTGAAECAFPRAEGFREADYNEAMTVYDLLCQSKPDARAAGQFVNMNSLSKLQSASAGLGPGFFRREAKLFDHREPLLRKALARMGGEMLSDGDAAARIAVFRDLSVVFRFWNSDDEFEPEIQFLWDANVLSFMHYETVWFANHVLVQRIQREMQQT